jgi:hypothetical protein
MVNRWWTIANSQLTDQPEFTVQNKNRRATDSPPVYEIQNLNDALYFFLNKSPTPLPTLFALSFAASVAASLAALAALFSTSKITRLVSSVAVMPSGPAPNPVM